MNATTPSLKSSEQSQNDIEMECISVSENSSEDESYALNESNQILIQDDNAVKKLIDYYQSLQYIGLQTTQQCTIMQTLNKLRQAGVQPIWQQIRSEMTFHLFSDFFFDLDPANNKSFKDQMLAFNHFKRVVQTKHCVQEQVLIVKLENVSEPLKDFSILSKVLKFQKQKRLRVISGLLTEYQKVIQNYEYQIQLLRVKRMLDFESVERKMVARNLYFEQALKYKFLQLTQQGYFYSYNKGAVNIEKGLYEIQEQGYSDSLICLLGSDPAQFSTTLMRRGFLQIQGQRHRDLFNIGRLHYEIFDFEKRSMQMKGCDGCLLTFDEQEIRCPIIVEHVFIDFPKELQIEEVQFKCEYAVFVIYDVSLNSLQQVMATRINNPQFKNDDWVNDFGYSIMSEILLEKYYSLNKQNKVLNSNYFNSLPPSPFQEREFD